MTRLFRRGELQAAVLDALAQVGPANGYTVMQALSERVGERWQPSPGAVYPALIGLQGAGLVTATERDGSREYALSEAGRRAARKASGTLDDVAVRARGLPRTSTLGSVVDEFTARLPRRQQLLTAEQEATIITDLDNLRRRIIEVLDRGK
jgi:DNA-binding PadR family transcriptional regulator